MREVLRSAVTPAYILLCIVLGGSVQGIWGVAALQLLAILIIGWSILAKGREKLSRSTKALLAIVGLAILLPLFQLVPLPPSVWTALPGRKSVAAGYALLSEPLPWLPISFAPYDTMETVQTLLPPVAVLAAMLVANGYRASWIVIAILVGTLAAVLLGALQVGSADPVTSPWYLYSVTNFGLAAGFFANSNHMATLLLISIPMLFALVADLNRKADNSKAGSGVLLLMVAGILVLLVGIFLNGSLAVLLLGLPVVMISAAILIPEGMRLRGVAGALALVSIAGILAVYLTPMQDKIVASNATSFNTRQTMWTNTLPAIKDHGLLGSGIGSYSKVYPQYEDQSAVDTTYVNHAHNEYLEIATEAGVPGILLLLAFLIWWGSSTARIWRSAAADRYAVAATIASAAMLIHSLVDYPLRTATLSTIMAACLALMARPRSWDHTKSDDLWPVTRHLSV